MSAARKKRQLSRHARGYTNAHVARRRQLEPLVATGRVACCRCGQLIEPGQLWHLDHRDDRRGYLGPSHAPCNLRAAAEKTNGQRKDHPLIWSRVWFEPIPPNVVIAGSVDEVSSRDGFLRPAGRWRARWHKSAHDIMSRGARLTVMGLALD